MQMLEIYEFDFLFSKNPTPRNITGLSIAVNKCLPVRFKSEYNNVKFVPQTLWESIIFYYKNDGLLDIIDLDIKEYKNSVQEKLNRAIGKRNAYESEKKNITKKYEYELVEGWKDISIEENIKLKKYLDKGKELALSGDNKKVREALKELLFEERDYNNFDEENDLSKWLTYLDITVAMSRLGVMLKGIEYAYCLNILEDLNNSNVISQSLQKLKWLGTPAQFGFVIQELIGKGYLEKPAGSNAKDVKALLEHFEVNGKESTIEKELSVNQNSMSANNRSRFRVPQIDSLK